MAIDVGANMGALSLHMADAVGEKGLVVSVEPTSYPLSRLSENLHANENFKNRVKMVQAFLVSSAQEEDPGISSVKLASVGRS